MLHTRPMSQMPTDVPVDEPDEIDWDAREEYEQGRADYLLDTRDNG
jgi:hypothetical protein